MTRSIAYRHKVVIISEDENTVSIEFELPDQLSEDEQIERAKQILFAVKDDVETGMPDMEVQPVTVLQVETTTYTTTYER